MKTPLNMKEMESKFAGYVDTCLFSTTKKKEFINKLLSSGDVYIFGGVIRDFFLDSNGSMQDHRDIDLVSTGSISNIENYLLPLTIRKTRFGGYALRLEEKHIDLWELKRTWAIEHQPRFEFILDEVLPATSFFNITAIVFSLEKKKFFYRKEFEKGIGKRTLDIVYEPNPFPELCIVKSIEYIRKYGLTISQKLRRYILKNIERVSNKLIPIQLSHYGRVWYDEATIKQFFEVIKSQQKRQRKYARRANGQQLELEMPRKGR